MIKGTLKEGELRIAQMQFDFMRQPMHVNVLAALVDPTIGDTRAWVPAGGVVWSAETAVALSALVRCMEKDIANVAMTTGVTHREESSAPSGGLGEFVAGGTPDAPQM